jgi:hypothetical protein
LGSVANSAFQKEDVIPTWQPILRCEDAPAEMSAVQRELFALAERGELLIEIGHFVDALKQSSEKTLQGISSKYSIGFCCK